MEFDIRNKIEDLYSKQEYHKAIQFCNKDIRISKDKEKRIAHYLRYHCYKNVLDYSKALKDLSQVIGKDTSILELYLERIYLLLNLNMTKQAEKDIKAMIIKVNDNSISKDYIQLDLIEKILKDTIFSDEQIYSSLNTLANNLSQTLLR